MGEVWVTAEALGDHFDLINAVGALGMVFLLRGDVHNAIPRLERSLVLTHTARNYDAEVYAAACLGHAYALSARHEEAVTLLERSVNQLEGVRRFGHSLWLSFLGHAYLHLGRTEAALERARLALELSRQNGERGSEAYAMRLLGEIASNSKCVDDETASKYYCRASELAEDIGMRPLVAHCHLGRGKLYRHTNEHEQALEHLTTAAMMYRDMGMTYWLERAEAVMVA